MYEKYTILDISPSCHPLKPYLLLTLEVKEMSTHKGKSGHKILNEKKIKYIRTDVVSAEGHKIEQILGKVLGYPELYPHVSTVDDGMVCVGEHVPETIAEEAAKRITTLEDQVSTLRNQLCNNQITPIV